MNIAYHLHTKEQDPRYYAVYSAEELFKILHNKKIQVIGITNKNSFEGIQKLKEEGVEERFKIFIPISAEVVTKNNVELLVVFEELNKKIERLVASGKKLSYLEVARYTKEYGGKVILPHMFSPIVGVGEKRGEELVNEGLVDAIEWNLYQENVFLRKRNLQAIKFAKKFNLPLIYGNDSYFDEINVIMKVKSENPEEAFWKIFNGKFEVKFKLLSLNYLVKRFYIGLRYNTINSLRILLKI